MEKALLTILMEISMKVILLMVINMGLGFILLKKRIELLKDFGNLMNIKTKKNKNNQIKIILLLFL